MKVLSIKINNEFGDTLKTFISRIGVFSIGLLFKIYLATVLSVSDNGLFGKWLALFNYGTIVFGLGLNLSLIYYSKSGEINEKDGFSFNSTVYFILFIFLSLLSQFFHDSIFYLSLIVSIIFGLLIANLNSVQLIRRNITKFNFTELSKNVTVFILFLLYFFITNDYSLDSLYFIYSFSLGIVFLLFFCREKGLELFNFKEIKNININYFKYGSKGLILNILGQSLYVVDIFFVESYAGDFNLGLYIVAGSIARLLWFFVDAAGTVIFPKLVNNDGQNSLDLISNLSKFSFYINILGIIIFSIFGKFLIEISFGISYAEAYSTIIVLLFASHGMVIYKLVNRYLASRDEWRISYIALGISLFVNILLNFILVPKYQIMGAAIASLVAYWLCGLIIALLSGVSLFKMVLGKISIR